MEEERNATHGTDPTKVGLEALLSNPDLISRIGSILSPATQSSPQEGASATQASPPPSAEASASPSATPSASSGEATASAPQSGGIDGLGALLANPAVLEALPQIISMLKPLMATIGSGNQSIQTSAIPSAPPAHSPATDRDHLLLSLKPFLSRDRQDAIDSILRIAKLGVLFKQLQ